ncbi:hypothetical protein D9758_000031 [Tetrapyrgos nigripes]|uniref:Uncharacterized protein n=1 Tax=Tetrapyrgos nigripes TaxID=182062 RepID=A0A8H5LZA7_9AGAR|nr:hypothetical protein D9758_000031 [Tetrapyrgos nigripes]
MVRVKNVWNYIPLPAMLKLVWDRLTFNRITTAYIIFSLVHCCIQLGLQTRAFTINADAARSLYNLSVQANAVNNSVPVLEGDTLELCSNVVDADCIVVWDGSRPSNISSNVNLESASFPPVPIISTSSSATPSSTSSPATTSSPISSKVTTTSVTSVVVLPPPTTSAPSTSELSRPISEQQPNNRVSLPEDDEDEDSDSDDEDSDDEDDFDSEDEEEHSLGRRGLKIMATMLENGTTEVKVSGPGFTNVELSKSCVWALNWPVGILENTKREDVVFIAFQIWVLGMSFVALMNESIPHVIASLLTHVLATVWSSFQISHTANFRADFNRVITNGACGVPLLGAYWDERAKAEYATLALNIAALFVSGFLSWKLFKSFGWLTFKRVGASLTINRIYKLVLVLSIILQLALFFMGATVGLWIDSLFNGLGAEHAEHVTFYRSTSFIAFLLLIPWIALGWIGVRKERRLPMFGFLVLSILYLGAWSTMFFSDTFRWLYLHWTFFCLVASASVFLTLSAFIVGLVCRYNFGKGLPRYLEAHEPLPGDDFAPVTGGSDIEKVAFPSEAPLPTYSAAFGKEVPPPSQMFPARMGPRFFRTTSEPFETPSNRSIVTVPSVAMTRTNSPDSTERTLNRSNSKSSERSFGSLASYYSYGSNHSRMDSSDTHNTMQGKRWVIE